MKRLMPPRWNKNSEGVVSRERARERIRRFNIEIRAPKFLVKRQRPSPIIRGRSFGKRGKMEFEEDLGSSRGETPIALRRAFEVEFKKE